jgi:acetyltransferase-like isoleucine patch superfamily enzyme/DNA-directed RNA polymerase subunit RPC12/RpoP
MRDTEFNGMKCLFDSLKQELMRFFGMYAPSRSIRVAMYRKAGIRIGRTREFGSNVWLDLNFKNFINIEDDVLLAGYTHILSHSFVMYGYEHEGFSPVVIKKRASIGTHVYILSGVTIGENSVIGAGAVVANDIPPNCLAAGVPAKVIKYFKSSPTKEEDLPPKPDMVYVICKTCNREFWSGIQSKKSLFATLDLHGNRHPCPLCGHRDLYSKKDYYFK